MLNLLDHGGLQSIAVTAPLIRTGEVCYFSTWRSRLEIRDGL
jgi:hypothetical protein